MPMKRKPTSKLTQENPELLKPIQPKVAEDIPTPSIPPTPTQVDAATDAATDDATAQSAPAAPVVALGDVPSTTSTTHNADDEEFIDDDNDDADTDSTTVTSGASFNSSNEAKLTATQKRRLRRRKRSQEQAAQKEAAFTQTVAPPPPVVKKNLTSTPTAPAKNPDARGATAVTPATNVRASLITDTNLADTPLMMESAEELDKRPKNPEKMAARLAEMTNNLPDPALKPIEAAFQAPASEPSLGSPSSKSTAFLAALQEPDATNAPTLAPLPATSEATSEATPADTPADVAKNVTTDAPAPASPNVPDAAATNPAPTPPSSAPLPDSNDDDVAFASLLESLKPQGVPKFKLPSKFMPPEPDAIPDRKPSADEGDLPPRRSWRDALSDDTDLLGLPPLPKRQHFTAPDDAPLRSSSPNPWDTRLNTPDTDDAPRATAERPAYAWELENLNIPSPLTPPKPAGTSAIQSDAQLPPLPPFALPETHQDATAIPPPDINQQGPFTPPPPTFAAEPPPQPANLPPHNAIGQTVREPAGGILRIFILIAFILVVAVAFALFRSGTDSVTERVTRFSDTVDTIRQAPPAQPAIPQQAGATGTNSVGILPPPQDIGTQSPAPVANVPNNSNIQVDFLEVTPEEAQAPIVADATEPMPEEISAIAQFQQQVQRLRAQQAGQDPDAVASGEEEILAEDPDRVRQEIEAELAAYRQALANADATKSLPRPGEFSREQYRPQQNARDTNSNPLQPPQIVDQSGLAATNYLENPYNLPIIPEPEQTSKPGIRTIDDFDLAVFEPTRDQVRIPKGIRPRLTNGAFPDVQVYSFVPDRAIIARVGDREGVLYIGETLEGWELVSVATAYAQFQNGQKKHVVTAD